MNSEVTSLSIFQQTVDADDGRTFLSCEGQLENGTHVQFVVNDETAVYPILTGTATPVKANKLGARALLHKKESGGLRLIGIEYTGDSRPVQREGDAAPVEYHGVRFSRVECIAAPIAPKMTFTLRAAAKKAAPQAQASA